MNLEQTLTDELRVVATGVQPPPPPDAPALVREAVRSRGRTRVRWATTTVLAAAAVVAAIVLGNQLGRPDAAPAPAKPTPTASDGPLRVGAPLSTYVDPGRGMLYIDGVGIPGGWGGSIRQGDVTIGWLGEGGQGRAGVFWGTKRVGSLAHVADDEVVISHDGRVLAWIEGFGGAVHLVVADVTPRAVHELGREALDPAVLETDSEGSERVISVADDHTVTYGGVLGGHAWRPGGTPQEADIEAYETRPDGFPNSLYPPQLNPAGTWGAWPTDRDGRGRRDDSRNPYAAITVQRPNQPDTRFTFARPQREGALQWMSWETDEDLVLAEADDPSRPTRYLRCNVVDHRCEIAPPFLDH